MPTEVPVDVLLELGAGPPPCRPERDGAVEDGAERGGHPVPRPHVRHAVLHLEAPKLIAVVVGGLPRPEDGSWS